jgi:histidine phosphotransferase ChpT
MSSDSEKPMLEGSRLATLVASKLCHDVMGPMGVMLQGIEMLKESDTAGRNAEALGLLEQSVTKAYAKMQFFRSALAGGLPSEGEAGLEDVRETAERLFTALKPDLVWTPKAVTMPNAVLRVALNVMLIAGECLPRGGKVTIDTGQQGDEGELLIHVEGPRAILKPDVAACLTGGTPEDGFQPYNIQAAMTGLLARQAGINVLIRQSAEKQTPERLGFVLRAGSIRIG